MGGLKPPQPHPLRGACCVGNRPGSTCVARQARLATFSSSLAKNKKQTKAKDENEIDLYGYSAWNEPCVAKKLINK